MKHHSVPILTRKPQNEVFNKKSFSSTLRLYFTVTSFIKLEKPYFGLFLGLRNLKTPERDFFRKIRLRQILS